MTRHTPPARGDESSAVGCLNVFEMLNRWILRILAESSLLAVACTEDVVAGSLDCENHEDVEGPKIDRVDGEILGWQAVDEWNPDQIAERQHEAEAVCGDVDLC